MQVSNIRRTSTYTGPAQSAATSAASASVRNFEIDIQKWKIEGRSLQTILGVGLMMFMIADLICGASGWGGAISGLGSGLAPPRNGLDLVSGAILLLQAAILAWSGWALLNSPWRRWFRPALRQAIPFAALLREPETAGATNVASSRRSYLGLVADVSIMLALATILMPLIGATNRVVPGGGALSALLVFIVAALGAWVGKAVASRVALRQDVADGDRDTMIGLVVALVAFFGAMLLSGAVTENRLRTAVADGRASMFMAAEALLLLLALGVLAAQFFSAQQDRLVEIFRVDPRDTSIRMEVPNCTRGDYKPFNFEVDANGQTVLLLATETERATTYRVCATQDLHEATTARYLLINLSQIQRRIASPIGLEYALLQGHFICRLSVVAVVRSPDSFLTTLRQSGVKLPIEEFTRFSDALMSTNDLGTFLKTHFRSVFAEIDRAVAAERRMESDVRLGGDALRTAAQQAKSSFRAAVTKFQNENRSVFQHDPLAEKDLLDGLVGRMDETLAAFDRNFEAARERFRGSAQLEQRAQEVAETHATRLLEQYQTQTRGSADANALIFNLVSFAVDGVTVTVSAAAAPVDASLVDLFDDVHAAHQTALDNLAMTAQEFGQRADQPFLTALESPNTPYNMRIRIIGDQLDARSSRQQIGQTATSDPAPQPLPRSEPQATIEQPQGRTGPQVKIRGQAPETTAEPVASAPVPDQRPTGRDDEPF